MRVHCDPRAFVPWRIDHRDGVVSCAVRPATCPIVRCCRRRPTPTPTPAYAYAYAYASGLRTALLPNRAAGGATVGERFPFPRCRDLASAAASRPQVPEGGRRRRGGQPMTRTAQGNVRCSASRSLRISGSPGLAVQVHQHGDHCSQDDSAPHDETAKLRPGPPPDRIGRLAGGGLDDRTRRAARCLRGVDADL